MMEPADHQLLAEVQAATVEPFRDPVRVGGVLVPRRLARHIERALLKLRTAEKRLVREAA